MLASLVELEGDLRTLPPSAFRLDLAGKPLLSALASRGRCRECGRAIDPFHWRVELGSALLGVAALVCAVVVTPEPPLRSLRSLAALAFARALPWMPMFTSSVTGHRLKPLPRH